MNEAGEPGNKPGAVVVLNGTSSAGKTSIAKALQEIMDEPYVHTGVDHFLPRLPAKFSVTSDGHNPDSAPYFLLVYSGGAQRMVAAREEGDAVYGSGILTEVRIGPKGVALLAAMYRGLAALAMAGGNVIVDDVIYDPRVLGAAVDALHDLRVLFVGLRLPREVAERRERERGDRGPGGAAAFYDLVHAHGVYDLELDTSAYSPMECAQKIKEELGRGRPWHTFQRLASAKKSMV